MRRQRELTSLKRWIRVPSVQIATIPTHLLCQMWRTLLELNSYEPYPSSEREIKFRLHLFMFSLKRKIGHFHVLVVQNSQKNYKKSVKHLLPTEPIGFFLTFSLPSRRWILNSLLAEVSRPLLAGKILKFLLYKRTHSPTLHKLHQEVSPLTDKF